MSIVFVNPSTGEHFRVVISGSKEVSPGVQRTLLRFARERAARGSPLAVTDSRILARVFSDKD